MQNKRKTIDTKFFQKKKRLLILSGSIIVLLLVGFAFHKVGFKAKKTLPETPQNSMKKIPPDVKRALTQLPQPSSISATLHIPILMYHYVEYVQDKNDKERQLLNVTPNIFERQLQTLITDGYTFITAKELGDVLDGIMQVPAKPIILTFDDGHWDLDTNVIPILKKYHIKATAYIVPGFVGTNTDSLTSLELQDVIDSGLVDVGAHTVHHISLKGKSVAQAKYEIGTSRSMLEQKYHIHVYSFAYPYGAFDQNTVDFVKQAGFTTAASTIAGNEQSSQNRFFLFRVRPGYNTGKALIAYLNREWHSHQP